MLTSASDWTYSFTDLPKFRAGKAIVYTVTEDSLDNYTPKTNGYDITNSYTPAKTSVSVSKLWDDKDDQDGLRPKSIKVQLYAGENPIGDPVTLDSDNQWATTFSDLDLKAKGQLISYTVKEVDTIKGYTPTINDIDQGNIIITNAHTPELIEVKGTKTWDDKDNQDGLRPDKIIVNLMDGETKVASKEVVSVLIRSLLTC
ncbi:Cna B-type domain-containing protein [Lactococcus carnosus]|uniref:Cna B-type domain-containing protein n=1 Tax=Pseudolactococcus carnosus TaxID=2749961 RepID=UPI001FD92BD9|nr:Cna B-type domain-containing protein [Lactococcus carnosus]